jgi:hypothetical protein
VSTATVKVCSHGQIVDTFPHPDTRIWHKDTGDFCTDRPEALKTATATLTVIPGTLR